MEYSRMSMVVVDNKELRETRLLVPDAKPVGPVQVDHDNKYGGNIMQYMLFDPRLRCLESSQRWISVSSSFSHYGIRIDTNTGYTRTTPGDNSTYLPLSRYGQLQTAFKNGVGVLIIAKADSWGLNGDFGRILYAASDADASPMEAYLSAADSGLRFRTSTGTDSWTIPNFNHTDKFALYMHMPSTTISSQVMYYRNMVTQDISTHSPIGSCLSTSSFSGTDWIYVGNRHLKDRGFDGVFELCVFFEGSVEDPEGLIRNPYQILKPA
jgi:hypothetical protein